MDMMCICDEYGCNGCVYDVCDVSDVYIMSLRGNGGKCCLHKAPSSGSRVGAVDYSTQIYTTQILNTYHPTNTL